MDDERIVTAQNHSFVDYGCQPGRVRASALRTKTRISHALAAGTIQTTA